MNPPLCVLITLHILQLTEPGRRGLHSPVVITSAVLERRTGHGHAQIRRPQTAAKCAWETISKVRLVRVYAWVSVTI